MPAVTGAMWKSKMTWGNHTINGTVRGMATGGGLKAKMVGL